MSSLLEEGDFAPIKSELQWLEAKQWKRNYALLIISSLRRLHRYNQGNS